MTEMPGAHETYPPAGRKSCPGPYLAVRFGAYVYVTMALLVLLAGGCTDVAKENRLANPDFARWGDGAKSPEGWRIEGRGVLLQRTKESYNDTRATAVTFDPSVIVLNSPFLFQEVLRPEELGGKTIELAAWIKTDEPEAVAIELSNRAGTDLKSAYHAGDGAWQRLEVSWRVPPGTGVIEYRLRFYSPASVLFAGASAVEKGWL